MRYLTLLGLLVTAGIASADKPKPLSPDIKNVAISLTMKAEVPLVQPKRRGDPIATAAVTISIKNTDIGGVVPFGPHYLDFPAMSSPSMVGANGGAGGATSWKSGYRWLNVGWWESRPARRTGRRSTSHFLKARPNPDQGMGDRYGEALRSRGGRNLQVQVTAHFRPIAMPIRGGSSSPPARPRSDRPAGGR